MKKIQTSSQFAPIVLFTYNRLEHTKKTIESLQKNDLAKESLLFIYSDAAKRDSEEEQVGEVRKYLNTIKGFHKVTVIKRKSNYGLARNIISGITEIVNTYGKVIVLEDDLFLSPHFLTYMNKSLSKYEKDEKVMHISAFMFPIEIMNKDDALFLPLINSWGWGTWRRSWKKMLDTKEKISKAKTMIDIEKFNFYGAYDFFSLLTGYEKELYDSWAIVWYLTVFSQNGLALFPRETLVENSGFDESGTNTGSSPFLSGYMNTDFQVQKYPKSIIFEKSKTNIHKKIQRFYEVMNENSILQRVMFHFRKTI